VSGNRDTLFILRVPAGIGTAIVMKG